MQRRIFLAALLSPMLPMSALAHSAKLGVIDIGHAWALPSVTDEGQVMMPLYNAGQMPDALMAASTPVAAAVELRNGSAVVQEFVLSPKKPFPMRAAASHLHLTGLTKPLEKGAMFPLTLTFKNAGQIEIQIYVAEKPGE